MMICMNNKEEERNFIINEAIDFIEGTEKSIISKLDNPFKFSSIISTSFIALRNLSNKYTFDTITSKDKKYVEVFLRDKIEHYTFKLFGAKMINDYEIDCDFSIGICPLIKCFSILNTKGI